MKNVLKAIGGLVVLGTVAGCQSDAGVQHDTPLDAVNSMNFYAGADPVFYSEFETLFLEDVEEADVLEAYHAIRENQSNAAQIMTTAIIEYDNGKVYLAHLVYSEESDNYFIHSVREVPKAVVNFLNGEDKGN